MMIVLIGVHFRNVLRVLDIENSKATTDVKNENYFIFVIIGLHGYIVFQNMNMVQAYLVKTRLQ